jgi:hypothetical protein
MDGPGTGAIDALLRDTRHALRRLARDWRFTAAAVLMLGLGIGVNTAIFSLINATLFRQQSFADPDRLVDIYQNGANPGGVDANSYPAYLDMAAYTDVFASTTAVFVPRGVNYLDEGAMRPAIVEHTTAAYPSVLGLRPSLGRWFNAAEDTPGAAVVAVVGHEAWTRKFRADPSVVGRAIRIEGVPVTIVGVGPSGHRGTINLGIVTDFWLPISSLPALGAPPRTLERRPEEAAFFVKARLRDGVTVAQAQAAMSILGARLARASARRSGEGHCGIRDERRSHPPTDGRGAAIDCVRAARRRRARAGHRLQQPGDAVARPRRRAGEGSVGPARLGRDTRTACPPPADGESAAVGGRRDRGLPAGVVDHPIAGAPSTCRSSST